MCDTDRNVFKKLNQVQLLAYMKLAHMCIEKLCSQSPIPLLWVGLCSKCSIVCPVYGIELV